MKSFREQPKKEFVPIHLVLETQEEVDKIYALFNHTDLANTLCMSSWYEQLNQFIDRTEADKYHKLLSTIIP